MANPNAMYTKALPAHEVATKLALVAAEAFTGEVIVLNVGAALDGMSFSVVAPSAQVGSQQEFQAFVSETKNRPSLMCATATLRHSQNPEIFVKYSTPDGIVGEFTTKAADGRARSIRFLNALEKNFKVTSYLDVVRSAAPAAEQATIALRERSVSDLERAVAKLAQFQSELFQREIENRQRIDKEQSEAIQTLTTKLEKDYRDRQADLDKKKLKDESAIAQQRKDLQDRIADFDTNESKYVRRKLLTEMYQVLAHSEKMMLSEPTTTKRKGVHSACWTLLVFGGTIAGSMLFAIMYWGKEDWHYFVGLASGAAVFVSTMIYYVKWNDRWFREHADGELAAKRYKADIVRASWIAELVQEWKKDNDGEFPGELISAFTRGMFQAVGPSRVSEHPIDDITDLIKRATRIDVGKGFFSVRTSDRKENESGNPLSD